MDEPKPQVHDAPTPEQGGPESPAEPQGGEVEANAPASPYKNLFVPLIVVPAIVVGVLVLVFALFGQIAGSEAGLAENVGRIIGGGKNEREQAVFSLVRQIEENRQAVDQGLEPPFPAEEGFEASLKEAWEAMRGEGEPASELSLTILLADLGDQDAVNALPDYFGLDEDDDPDGQLRFFALSTAARHGGPEMADDLIALLDGEDMAMRLGAATALQRMPGPKTADALAGQLGDPNPELRLLAANSLSYLGDDRGRIVLLDLLETEVYEAEHASNPKRFADPRLVIRARILAIEALARLADEEGMARIAVLAEGDESIEVREAAMIAIRGGGEPPE